jgi:hypothetical protein
MTDYRFDDRNNRYSNPRDRSSYGYDSEERGFFERARDEVASWFGDERADVRRDLDERYDRFAGDRSSHSIDSDRNIGGRERSYGAYKRGTSALDDDHRRPYTGRTPARAAFVNDYGSERAHSNDRWDRGTTQGHPSQQDYGGSATGLHDRDYSSWRRRQIDDLDRDYDEFRRENSARFENEFTSWRNTRQIKRKVLTQLSEHMDVVGSDGEAVGKVDKVVGDRVVLTRSDSPDGKHHWLSCGLIDKVEDGRLLLEKPASEAIQQLTGNDHDRSLFEREQDRSEGPHMLNRSFSGTY